MRAVAMNEIRQVSGTLFKVSAGDVLVVIKP
jgi:hypothetical protein